MIKKKCLAPNYQISDDDLLGMMDQTFNDALKMNGWLVISAMLWWYTLEFSLFALRSNISVLSYTILYIKIVTSKLEVHFLPHFYPINLEIRLFTNKIYNLDNHTMHKLFANKIHEISERNVIIFWLNFDCMFLTVNFGKVCKNRFFSSFLVKTRLQREKFVFVASKNNYVLA